MTRNPFSTTLIRRTVLPLFAIAALSGAACTPGGPQPAAGSGSAAPTTAAAPKATAPAPANQAPAQAAPPAAADSMAALVEPAKKEGKVVMYAGSGAENAMQKIAKLFKDKYGIQAEFVFADGAATQERVLTEMRTNRRLADIASAGVTNMWTMQKEGAFEKWRAPTYAELNPELQVDPDGIEITQYVNTYGVMVNTDLVKPEEYPKTWKDLSDPKWRGKLSVIDPRTSGGGNIWFSVTQRVLGSGYHEQISKIEPLIQSKSRELEQSLARGQFAIGAPVRPLAVQLLEGAPVKWLPMDDGLIFVAITQAVIKDAPHPNAAKLFANYLLSQEAQQILVDEGITGVRKDLKFPNRDVSLDFKIMGTVSLAETDRAEDSYTLAESIYGIH